MKSLIGVVLAWGIAQGAAFTDGIDWIDPLIGTEGRGSEYGGMMPMTGVPFGSMHLVPMTRTNGVARTSFNALDRELLGFVLTRQPAIWMGEWGAVRISLRHPLPLESIVAKPYLTVVKAGGRTYELTASSHAALIRSDDAELGAGLPIRGETREYTARSLGRAVDNFACRFAVRRTGDILAVGVSLVSEEDAVRNLAEETSGGFDAVASRTRDEWRTYFSRVRIEAPNDVKRIFYTGLYHALLYPRLVSERGRHYSAMDDRIHDGEAYNCFSLWDTYRSEHPLLTLIAPDRVDGMMQSLVDMYKEGGWLPMWPNPGYTGVMIGGPAEVVLAEAYVKGFRGFDYQTAYAAMVKNATVPQIGDMVRDWYGARGDVPGAPETRGGLSWYLSHGYVACDKTGESVSRTLDYAFDDAAIAAMARALGRTDDAVRFAARAKNYTNVWDAAARRFRPRRTDGAFERPSREWSKRAYTETNEDSARWCVPHDVEGLVALMGGREEFERELDRFFETQFFVTDTVGNRSVHGNETCHHVAYLYNRIGAYDKTCRRVRDILGRCYSTDRKGFDGNEDCGAMSAWYVLSALGFYPLDPASGEYELGSPLVRSAVLTFGRPYACAELKVVVLNYAPDRWRVKRVTFNGRELTGRRISHREIVGGGELVFTIEPDSTKEVPLVSLPN